MPDTINLRLELGSWADEAEGEPLQFLADAQAYADYELDSAEFVDHFVSGARDADWNPWAHRFEVRSFYGGASAEHWTLVLDIAPYAGFLVSDAALQIIGSGLAGAIFGKLISIPRWRRPQIGSVTLAEASERVRQYVVQRDSVAPNHVKELAAEQLDDGTYQFAIRRESDGHEFVFRVDERGGIIARVDLTELDAFRSRVLAKKRETS